MGSSILLVSFDTLRADVAYSGNFPTIERIRRNGVAFSRTVTAAPLTPPSHASVFSGLFPPRHGLRHLFRETVDERVTLLAESFQQAGYRTGAIVSCPGLNAWYGFDRGFDHYDDEIPRLADGSDPLRTVDVKLRGTALKRADIVGDRALRWLDQEPGSDFFLFLHFFDAHWPYEAPVQGLAKTANPYEDEVAFMDHHLGRVLDGCEARGLSDRLMIGLFSDHGEDLAGWYGNDKAGPGRREEEDGHGALLFDQTQMTMLVLAAPGRLPTGLTLDNQVRLVDIAPTLLELAGLAPDPSADGPSLSPLWRGEETGHRPAYFETFYREEIRGPDGKPACLLPLAGVRLDDRWKVIWEPAGPTAGAVVYDLAADPAEFHPVLRLGMPADAVPDAPERDDVPTPALSDFLHRLPAAAAGPVAALIRHLSAIATGDVRLSGSYAKGEPDTWSDIDLTVVFPTAAPGRQGALAVQAALRSSGRVLASFPASHLGLDDLVIAFVECGGEVLKIDINCVGPGYTSQTAIDSVCLLPGRQPLLPPRAAGAPRPDPRLCWERLIGWTHYCHGKIQRGEAFEALDSLHAIRSQILIPALRSASGLPDEGARRLERLLTETDRSALAVTVPGSLARPDLGAALAGSVRLGRNALLRAWPDAAGDAPERLGRMADHLGLPNGPIT